MPKRDIAGFIAHWSAACPSGRANSQAFLLELCDLLEVPAPDNPRAAAIAELVLWIGYLQWHFKLHFKLHSKRTPPEPILCAFKNIHCRDAVLAYDGEPQPVTWAVAVANPDLPGLPDGVRAQLRSGASADRRKPSVLIQNAALYRDAATPEAGLITTNSLRQTFARRVVQLHLNPGRDALPRVPNNPSAREAQTKVRAAPQRSSTELAVKEKLIHDQGLVSVLKQIGKFRR